MYNFTLHANVHVQLHTNTYKTPKDINPSALIIVIHNTTSQEFSNFICTHPINNGIYDDTTPSYHYFDLRAYTK